MIMLETMIKLIIFIFSSILKLHVEYTGKQNEGSILIKIHVKYKSPSSIIFQHQWVDETTLNMHRWESKISSLLFCVWGATPLSDQKHKLSVSPRLVIKNKSS